jgi:hypothetical protein
MGELLEILKPATKQTQFRTPHVLIDTLVRKNRSKPLKTGQSQIKLWSNRVLYNCVTSGKTFSLQNLPYPTGRVTLLFWHKERVENIRSETEIIENLANFDDGHFAETASGFPYSPGSVRSEVGRVAHLFRVRRLFEEGARAPEQVLPLLRQAYKEALDAWPRARIERITTAAEAYKAYGVIRRSEPDAFNIVLTRAVATTYLLAELKDYDALPVLVEGYRLQAKWMDELPPAIFTLVPVPTTMTLYAIHRLVRGMKPERMSPAARTARQAYMDWAEKKLPEPTTIRGTAWNSLYDESDPYLRII